MYQQLIKHLSSRKEGLVTKLMEMGFGALPGSAIAVVNYQKKKEGLTDLQGLGLMACACEKETNKFIAYAVIGITTAIILSH